MKRIIFPLLAAAAIILLSYHPARAQVIKSYPLSACGVLSARDFAAVGLPLPRLVMYGATGCQFIFGAPSHFLTVGARPLATVHGSDILQPNVCSTANAQAHQGQHCTPVFGYGKFGALLTGIGGPARAGATIIFKTSRYQVSVFAMGVPGGNMPAAVQRLGKILAARYR